MMALRLILAAALLALPASRSFPQAVRVSVQVVVLGADGLPVGDLARDDFEIRVNGQPRAIESFSAASPASVALLLDVSSSFDFTFGRGNLVKAMDHWLASRRLSEDRWMVGSFARRLSLSALFTDRDEIGRAARAAVTVPDADRFGPSPAWDATEAGVTALESEAGARGVILVTDGRVTGNRRGMRDVMIHAITAGVPVSVISNRSQQIFALSGSSALLVQPEVSLQLMADQTGGAFLPDLPTGGVAQAVAGSEGGRVVAQMVDIGKLGALVDRIAEEVRRSYVLSFSSVPDRTAQRLQVVVKRAGLTTRARKTHIPPPITSAATSAPARERPPRP